VFMSGFYSMMPKLWILLCRLCEVTAALAFAAEPKSLYSSASFCSSALFSRQ
jgi:hypothetical protein